MREKWKVCLMVLVLGTSGFVFWIPCAVGQADSPLVIKGEKVYGEKKCAICHSIHGKGGKIGGDLRDVGAKRDREWLHQFMKNPKALNPDVKMSKFRGSEEDLEALVGYLLSVK